MSLRMITGRAGTGKTAFIHQEIATELKNTPFGDPILILVPDQMTFQTEYELTNHYGLEGIMRAQVLTFKRLAWFILQETGGIAKEKVDAIGYRMMLRRILEERKEDFKLFRHAAGKSGFTKEIEQLLKEFSQYQVNTQAISMLIDTFKQQQKSQTLISKMEDIQVILAELEARLGTGYIDGDGFFDTLKEKIPQSESIRNAHIYLDGYMAFTGQEFELLKLIILYAKRVTITLSLEDPKKDLQESSLFHRPATVYEKIMKVMGEYNSLSNVSIELEKPLHFTEVKRFENEDLLHVERFFHAPRFTPKRGEGNVKIIEGANPRAEVHAIAREIKRLVQEENVRYKDIGIIYRSADVYDPILNMTFAQYGIPMFSNEKRPMLYHPLIEFSRSAFEIVQSNWRYEPVFRAVKTDLFFDFNKALEEARQNMDEFENYCIARGIQGDRWKDEAFFEYRRFQTIDLRTTRTTAELEREKFLKKQRSIIMEPLLRFENKVKKAKIGRDYAIALFELVDELSIYEKLVKLSNKESKKAQNRLAGEHEQAWNSWMNVLEQFNAMFGSKELSLEEVSSILQEGYEALLFTSIPPSIDEVTVSTVEHSRFNNMPIIFVIGVNDGAYPKRMDAGGLLTDEEREAFNEADFELAPSVKSRLMQESYLFYRAITSPKQKLYITLSNADEEGKGKLPSIYISRLQKLFEVKISDNETESTLPVERVLIDPIEEIDQQSAEKYLRHPAPALGYLMTQLKSANIMRKPLPPIWQALKAYYEEEPKWQSALNMVKKPLNLKNEAESLDEKLAEELYGKQFTASVSRVENYYSCAFAHFISYGLKLRERQQFKLETFAMGDLFHDALRRILTEKDGLMSKDSSFRDCMTKAEETVNEIIEHFSYQILQSSARYDYIKKKLIKIVGRTLYALLSQHRISQFVPIAHEKSFGMKGLKSGTEEDEAIEGLKVKLKNDREMVIRGQIDRIDGYRAGKEVYLRVIDYKSSKRDLNLTEVYHGVSLQLLTYLEVASQNALEIIADSPFGAELDQLEDIIVQSAGIFYFHVHNPLLSVSDYSDLNKLEEERLKQYKLKGLALEDLDVATAMDTTLEPSKSSIVVPIGLTKDSKFNSRISNVIEDEKMNVLKKFVPRKLAQAGNEIYAGNTAIKPYRLGSKQACTFCEYKSICQFDPSDHSNAYNELKSLNKEEVFEKLKQVVNGDE